MSNFKKVHILDPVTGDYLHDYEAQEDPQNEGSFIEPTDSTDSPLPARQDKKWPRFIAGDWLLVDDFRGDVWFTAEGLQVEIEATGTPVDLFEKRPVIVAPVLTKQQKQDAMDAEIDASPALQAIIESNAEDRGTTVQAERQKIRTKVR